MAKLVRYTGNLLAFAANATGTNRTVFGGITQSDTLDANIIADYLTGWEIVSAGENPTKQDFNAMGFTLGQLLAYLHQVGVAEWDSLQEYHIDSMTNRNGAIYASLTNTNIGNDPATDTTNWKIIAENNLVDEVIVSGGAVTQLDFTGLDLNTHKQYRIEFDVVNALAAAFNCSLFINGDTVITNYYTQKGVSNGAVHTDSRGNESYVYGGTAIVDARVTLTLSLLQGVPVWHGVSIVDPSSAIYMTKFSGVNPGVVANITQITFAASVANALGNGTRVRIYREDI